MLQQEARCPTLTTCNSYCCLCSSCRRATDTPPPPKSSSRHQKSNYSEQSGWAGRAPNGESGAPSCAPKIIRYLLPDLSNFLSLCITKYRNGDENTSCSLKSTPSSPSRRPCVCQVSCWVGLSVVKVWSQPSSTEAPTLPRAPRSAPRRLPHPLQHAPAWALLPCSRTGARAARELFAASFLSVDVSSRNVIWKSSSLEVLILFWEFARWRFTLKA